MGALLAVRLSRKIQDALQMELEVVRYFTDSAVVLGMILRESATYQEFIGTRVSEIRTKSDPETEWFWITGEMNIADMGTRPTVVPKDMGPGTPYQEGLPWMRGPPETWPAKKTYAPPPPKDMMAMVMTTWMKSGLWYLPSADTRAKLERGYHLLSRLYLEEAHRTDHAGVDAMVIRSRSQVWIKQVRPKAKAVRKRVLHVQEISQEVGGAEDGTPA
jgi:hypothetical protein